MRKTFGIIQLAFFVALVSPSVESDTITLDGVHHTDVLVSETSKTYYVMFPDTGELVSRSKETVDASTVSINNEPYYRDELKARFEAAKIRAAGGGEGDGTSMIGLGVSRAALQELLTATGFEFEQGSTGIVTGATVDGAGSVELLGPAANLTHIRFRYAVAEDDVAMQQGAVLQIQRLSRSVEDWILPWVEQNGGHLVQDGKIEKTEAGVYVSVTRVVSGGMARYEFAARPEGAEAFPDVQVARTEDSVNERVATRTERAPGLSGGRVEQREGRDGFGSGAGLRGVGGGRGQGQVRGGEAAGSDPFGRQVLEEDVPPEFGAGAPAFPGEMSEEELSALLAMVWIPIIVLSLLYYIHYAVTLQVTANKAGTEQAWLAWIPIIQMILMVRIAEKPWWWFLLMFVPVVSLVIWILTWIGIAEARGKAGWLGALTIVPIASFFVRTYLAFSE